MSYFLVADSSNKFVAAPNIAFDVRGTGSNLKLFAVSGDKGSIMNNYRVSFYYHESLCLSVFANCAVVKEMMSINPQ